MAIGSRILPNQCDFARAGRCQILRFAQDGFEAPAPERPAKLRDDAKTAWMIASFRDLDVGGMPRCGDDTRRQFVVEKSRRRGRWHAQLPLDGFEDPLDFTRSDHCIHFRYLLQDVIPKALDEASSDNQLFHRSKLLVLCHLQNRLDGLLLRRLDEAARIDDQDVRLIRPRSDLIAAPRENAHHHLAVHEVFGTTQADESDFRHRRKILPAAQISSVARTRAGRATPPERESVPAKRLPDLLKEILEPRRIAGRAAKSRLRVQ